MTTLNSIGGSSKNIRRFLVLFATGIMSLVSYADTFSVASDTITKSQRGNFYIDMDSDDEKMTKQSVGITIFRGRMLAEPNLLVWQTIKEKNNKGFEAERSQNGMTWNQIGFVEGHGSTRETHDYEFSDDKPLKGINYYRLKQIGSNGKYEYTEMVILERKSHLTEEILVQND